MQSNVNNATITQIKNNNESIQNFAAKSIQSSKNIKRISSVKVPDVKNVLDLWCLSED